MNFYLKCRFSSSFSSFFFFFFFFSLVELDGTFHQKFMTLYLKCRVFALDELAPFTRNSSIVGSLTLHVLLVRSSSL